MTVAAACWVVLGLAGAYGAVGVVVAAIFAATAIGRVMPEAGRVTWGARLLLLPGLAALWPLVLRRWPSRVPEKAL